MKIFKRDSYFHLFVSRSLQKVKVGNIYSLSREFLSNLGEHDVFRVSTNIYNVDLVSKKAVYYTLKAFKFNQDKDRMEKKFHLSIHHCELMGLVLKYRSWLESHGEDEAREVLGQVGETASVEEKAEQEKQEAQTAEEVQQGEATDEDDQALVVFKAPKRPRKTSQL